MDGKNTMVSRIVRSETEKVYMEVDGKPFLYQAVQSWYPPEKDYSIYIQKAVEVHYKVFSFWLYWRHIEPTPGNYEWAELEKVIILAEKHNIRLDIVWGGSNFCGQVDSRFAPDWLLNGHEFHVRGKDGECVILPGGDMGDVHIADCRNRQLMDNEKNAVQMLMNYLKERDISHRVIAIQVENEINMKDYTGGKPYILKYVNEIGRVVKESGYEIVTRANIFALEMDPELDCLEYIDGHGCDTYNWDVGFTRRVILSPYNTKLKYIAENAAFRNSTAHMVAALANGGFYNVYKLDFDSIWEKPGVYKEGFLPWEVTYEIANLNEALNKIAELIAVSDKIMMAEFNTETCEPKAEYYRVQLLGGRKIGFTCNGNGAVGLATVKGKEYYLVADKKAIFYFYQTPVRCEAGEMEESGEWVASSCRKSLKADDGSICFDYNPGECLNVVF